MNYNQQLINIRRNLGIGAEQDVVFPGTDPSYSKVTLPVKPPMDRPQFNYTPVVAPMPALELPKMGEMPKFQAPAAPGTPGGVALPELQRPEIKTAQFQAPEWEEKEITKLAQRRAAPGVRGLKEGLREMTATTSSNDPIARHNARSALAGYGKGLSDVMAGAHSAAVQEYSQRYGYEFQAAAMQFEAEADAIAREYQGNLAANMAEYEGKLQAVMADYQTKVQGASLEHQAAFNTMMRQYEIESQASMLRYETKARRQELQAELQFKAAALDFDSLMQDYMAQYGEETTGYDAGAGGAGAGPGVPSAWKPGLFSGQLGHYQFSQAQQRSGFYRNAPWANWTKTTSRPITSSSWPTLNQQIAVAKQAAEK